MSTGISHTCLGSGGYVECLVQGTDGRVLLITRRADARDRITVVDDKGHTQQLTSADNLPFPISILGWHEIEAVADKAEARIGLLDRIGNAAEIRAIYGDIRAQIEQCATSCRRSSSRSRSLIERSENSGIFRASERRWPGLRKESC